jgi:addiction module HigA family antidote
MASQNNRVSFTPDYIVPPGASMRDTMEQLSMTQTALAVRLNTTVQSLNRIFNGDQPITPDMSVRLEMVLGVPARFWNNLQVQYDELQAKRKEKERLAEEQRQRHNWLQAFPLGEMRKRGYLPVTKDATETYRNLLAFFGLSNGEAWSKFWDNAVAARRSAKHQTDLLAAAVWIRQGERLANAMACAGYDADKFKMALRQIRGITNTSPDSFIPAVTNICSQAGVALALVPELPKVPWNGATKWIRSNKALIILSLRGKREDTFWFSFFHEASHVLHDAKGQLHYADESDDPVERGADKWASEYLIPEKFNGRIAAAQSYAAIQAIAAELALSPGIVAGRHGHLTGKLQLCRKLIRSLTWKDVSGFLQPVTMSAAK